MFQKDNAIVYFFLSGSLFYYLAFLLTKYENFSQINSVNGSNDKRCLKAYFCIEFISYILIGIAF